MEGLGNVAAPLDIDVCCEDWGVGPGFDAIVAINMIHISPWGATLGLMAGAARLLGVGGTLVTYGPYMRNGRHTAASNQAFDASLRARNSSWGVRDLADVEGAALARGLRLRETIEMPVNNLSLVFVVK